MRLLLKLLERFGSLVACFWSRGPGVAALELRRGWLFDEGFRVMREVISSVVGRERPVRTYRISEFVVEPRAATVVTSDDHAASVFHDQFGREFSVADSPLTKQRPSPISI
jgi:hypothetical protein